MEDVEVYAHNFPDECFSDGVLGINVLERFNFSIDFDENTIVLVQRKDIAHIPTYLSS